MIYTIYTVCTILTVTIYQKRSIYNIFQTLTGESSLSPAIDSLALDFIESLRLFCKQR